MIFQKQQLPAALHVVSTPIGNARDITLRALDVLASVDVLVAEDTRRLRKLMEIHGIDLAGRPLWSYHDHSRDRDRERVCDAITAGQSVAYVSDAGTPLVADPGFKLVAAATAGGLNVTAVPGASAVLAAMAVGAIGTDRFTFVGFLPSAQRALVSAVQDLKGVDGTLVIYESGRRVRDLLGVLCETLGADRPAALCRELTKKFETVTRGSLQELVEMQELETRGECVVLVGRSSGTTLSEDGIDEALQEALKTMRMKDAATAVAGALGLNRRDVYQRALALSSKGEEG